ncbi:protein of unknown function (plasmid) [Cupriavidus taiwanensis]|nr:protein of unknown function [Cupriavidus taiwanensis]
MRRIYAHAVGTSCAVVADAILAGSGSRRQGKCGARLGCHVCQMAEDKSLANMVEYDGRYAYAAGLQRLNRFIRHTRFDWHRRHWVGRTIRRGFIKIQPDTYHPTMVRALVRYMLQLDYDEQCRAERAGERPKFELLPLDLLIAVDALQSLNGLARPFAAWADWRDIRMRVSGTIFRTCHRSARQRCQRRASCMWARNGTTPPPPRNGPACATRIWNASPQIRHAGPHCKSPVTAAHSGHCPQHSSSRSIRNRRF